MDYKNLNKELQRQDFDYYCKVKSNDSINHDYELLEGRNMLLKEGGIVSLYTKDIYFEIIPTSFAKYRHLKKYLEELKANLDKLSFYPLNEEIMYFSKVLSTNLTEEIDSMIQPSERAFILNPNIVMVDMEDKSYYYIKSYNLPNYEMYKMFQLIKSEYLLIPINPESDKAHLGLHKMLNLK